MTSERRHRHGRACPGHPRLAFLNRRKEDVDARIRGLDEKQIVMAGHSRSKNGVAEFTLGLAEGKTRGLAYVPAIHA
jgi:hypothetical protein